MPPRCREWPPHAGAPPKEERARPTWCTAETIVATMPALLTTAPSSDARKEVVFAASEIRCTRVTCRSTAQAGHSPVNVSVGAP